MVCHLNCKSLEGELSIGDEVNLMDQSSGDELSIGALCWNVIGDKGLKVIP